MMYSMETSPFPYQGPLKPEEVQGRDALITDLAQRISDRRLTALLGPRRYGKTSVLKRVASDLHAATGMETVWIDLYQLNSMADLAGAFDVGLAAVEGPLRRSLRDLALDVKLTLGVVAVELRQDKRRRPDATLTLHLLLDVLIAAAQRHPMCLVLDEFSGIVNVDGGAGVLRTKLQHHYRELGIVFAGSEPSTMSSLFSDRAQPFFAQADLVATPPLDAVDLTQIIIDGFEATGRGAGDAVDPLVELANGHPQRAMQLADSLWRHTEPGETATVQTWRDAVADVRAAADLSSERLFALLPAGHQRTLRAIASGGSPYGTSADVLELAPGTARGAIAALTGNGMLAKPDGRLELVDPLLADFLQRRFPV